MARERRGLNWRTLVVIPLFRRWRPRSVVHHRLHETFADRMIGGNSGNGSGLERVMHCSGEPKGAAFKVDPGKSIASNRLSLKVRIINRERPWGEKCLGPNQSENGLTKHSNSSKNSWPWTPIVRRKRRLTRHLTKTAMMTTKIVTATNRRARWPQASDPLVVSRVTVPTEKRSL